MSFLYRSPKTEVRKSSIEGMGVFAIEKIFKNETVALKTGHIVQGREAVLKIEEECGDYSFEVREGFYLCPLTRKEALETAVYINHSCDPNVGVDGDIGLAAMRDIEFGEELCYDYSMSAMDPLYHFECHCGSKLCRKIVNGDDWKKKELQERYGIYFGWCVLKKIKGWD